ncbi:MAG: membrane protein FxsA [bacterium]|nr:membrane protein FxsA [bacterium]
MFGNLLLLFIVVPIVEIYILVNAGQVLGTWNTIGIVILTGVAGASFAKSEGARVIYDIRNAMAAGQMPGRELMQGAMILAGGIMLLTPGFLTDIVGFSLLIPFTRKLYSKVALNYFKKKMKSGQWQATGGDNGFRVYTHDGETDPENDPEDNIIEHPRIEK